jgi:CheY-like chemotaxis protein
MTNKETTASILVAEDDDDDFLLTEKALRGSGFQGRLLRAKDGEELMSLLHDEGRERAPLLLLLDLNMPCKDGREALKEIKAHPVLRRIPIVVLTTSGSEFDISSSYDLGANSYVRKPTSFEQFARFIEALNRYWLEVADLPRPSPQGAP